MKIMFNITILKGRIFFSAKVVLTNRRFPFEKRKLFSIIISTNDRRIDFIALRQGWTVTEHEREQQRARTNKCSFFAPIYTCKLIINFLLWVRPPPFQGSPQHIKILSTWQFWHFNAWNYVFFVRGGGTSALILCTKTKAKNLMSLTV